MEGESRNVAASVNDRLLTLARNRGQELQRLLVHYALERFLYRLGHSDHADRWAGIVHLSEGIEQPMLGDSLTGDPLQVTLFM